jgi:hypothetical protein
MNPRHILRVEGVAIFVAATVVYYLLNGPFWLYLLLFFAPDLGMLGYLVNPRIGSWTYNVAHTYAFPIVLFSFGIWQMTPLAMLIAAIWTAHIGFDRVLTYGLKFPSDFGDTHLDRERFTTHGPTAGTETEPQDEIPHLSR